MEENTLSVSSYDTGRSPTWCPGCGDFGIWMSLKSALVKLGLKPDDLMIVYGIGCHGNMSGWMKTYACEGLHGRTLPLAQGVKLARHDVPVIVVSGDGDGIGEGGNHFLHASKRNPDVTVVLHDNQLYSLTTGQASPTAKPGFKTKSTPEGVYDEPINPLTLALAAGATYVARAFAGDAAHTTQLIVDAVKHKGFSIVDILQPCVTFDKIHTYPWYRQRVYKLEAEGYKTDSRENALIKAMEWGDRIPIGLFYRQDKPTSEDRENAISQTPLALQPQEDLNVDEMLSEFI